MTNTYISIVYLLLICIIIIVALLSLVKKNYTDLDVLFYSLSFIVVLLLAINVVFLMVKTESLTIYFFTLRAPFYTILNVIVFLTSLRFYRQDLYLNSKLKIILFIFPTITLVASLFTSNHDILYYGTTITELLPLKLFTYKAGIWTITTQIYGSVCLSISFFVIITQHFKIRAEQRVPSTFFAFSIILYCIGQIITIFIGGLFDFTATFSSISIILLYISISGNSHLDFLSLARNDIFNFLEEYVFILDNENFIVEINQSAVDWLNEISFFGSKPIFYPDIFAHLKNIDAKIIDNEDQKHGTDIFLTHNSQNSFYNVIRKPLTIDGVQLGYYVKFMNVTRYKVMINNLEKTAGVDPLTGLSNRLVYEHNKKILDRPQYFPLCIIIGDVNGLKKVNDTMGHAVGDKLLKVIAFHIKQHCPKKATVARVGGDEFFIVLPNSSENEAESIVQKIQYSLAMANKYSFKPSISMGIAIKYNIDESLEKLITVADANMYKAKGANRRRD